ncbi:hypothetical protein OB236_37370 [Paenibacillus sp. WQ 127069]|uniref:Butirosin biosynthesis protein H N-terminal domain-containing protein n=1 Tax=Paenibacillus baimaensis TaxID=2982185 RepID=A0ABT2UT16_9BACL|nr:hypothetical protein [Paenibacillus sp. WQ 127069]MCU6797808.1 hypothetical protein [Paenibacillus sp. WQ 127069]
MKQQWVDCYIDKLLALYPQVHAYAAMIDRWAFIPEWSEVDVDFDLTRVLATERQLFELYGIRRQYNSGWIDDALRSGLQVLLPCDLFYLPHAKVFYGQEHAGHYIWVQQILPNGEYRIYDDHPAFQGAMAGKALRQAHEAMRMPYQALEPRCSEISEEQALMYTGRMLQTDTFHLGSFANQLIASTLPPIRKCEILKGTRHMQHRLSGLIRIFDVTPLPPGPNDEMVAVRQAVSSYMDGWRATVNLALKGLLLPVDKVWGRLEERLVKHAEGDQVLADAVIQFKGKLTSVYQQGGGLR